MSFIIIAFILYITMMTFILFDRSIYDLMGRFSTILQLSKDMFMKISEIIYSNFVKHKFKIGDKVCVNLHNADTTHIIIHKNYDFESGWVYQLNSGVCMNDEGLRYPIQKIREDVINDLLGQD